MFYKIKAAYPFQIDVCTNLGEALWRFQLGKHSKSVCSVVSRHIQLEQSTMPQIGSESRTVSSFIWRVKVQPTCLAKCLLVRLFYWYYMYIPCGLQRDGSGCFGTKGESSSSSSSSCWMDHLQKWCGTYLKNRFSFILSQRLPTSRQ